VQGHVRWLDPISSFMRLVAITQFMLIWLVVELNTLYIKHIFRMPAEHPICVTRILMTGLIAAPIIRQYYTCKRPTVQEVGDPVLGLLHGHLQ
jgi:phosphatidylserine synthase 1